MFLLSVTELGIESLNQQETVIALAAPEGVSCIPGSATSTRAVPSNWAAYEIGKKESAKARKVQILISSLYQQIWEYNRGLPKGTAR